MALPTERTVTGTYVNPVTGEPYDGTTGSHYVIFEPIPARWTDQGGNQILLGGGRVNLDANGHFEEAVVCTDASGVLPEDGRLWRLRQFVGGAWSTGLFKVPVGTGDLDITDILSVDICDVDYVPVPGPPGTPGADGAPGADGLSSDNGGLTTGITFGGDLEFTPGNPIGIDISPLRGYIVNYLVDPITAVTVETTSVTTVELDTAAQSRLITWFMMDADKNVIQQEARPSATQRRQFLVLGFAVQFSGQIFASQSIPVIIQQPINQLYDLMESIGSFNISGNEVTPNGANLKANHAGGTIFSVGWNHYLGPTLTSSPHIVDIEPHSPASWIHVLRATDVLSNIGQEDIDVSNYDLNGTLTPVGGGTNRATVMRLWTFPSLVGVGNEAFLIQYGQTVHANVDAAVAAIGTESFVVNPALPVNGVLVGFLAVRHTATDLSDENQARFVPASKFGGAASGSASQLALYALLAGATFTGTVGSELDDSGSISLRTSVTGDAFPRFQLHANGDIAFGPGNASLDSFFRRIAASVLGFVGTDLQIGQEAAKAFRFRQSGTALDLDGAGADFFLSIYELVDFAGTQRTYLRLENAVQLAHAIGRWEFTSGPSASAVHTLDGTADVLGFHGATPVGQQTVTGERTTGEALTSALTALDALGLIADTSTAGPAVVETVNSLTGPDVTLDATEIIVAASDSRSSQGAHLICNGSDDQDVIQQAIDLVDAAPGKGVVRLLDGTFNISATISIPSGAGLAVIGSGWGTSLKLTAAADDYVITFVGGETRATFRDFTVDGSLATQTGASGGISAPGAVECVFQHIHFTECRDTGLFLGPQTGPVFGHNNYITQCLFDNADTSPAEGRGIHIQSNDENFIIACDFQFLGGAGAAGAAGIYDQAGTQNIIGCNFVGGGNSLPSIRVQDAAATKITSCNFDGVGGDGVFLAATNCIITGNTFFGIGAIGTAGTYSGVHLEFGARNNLISGNTFSSTSTDDAARSFIREENVGDSGGNLIINNVLVTDGTLSVAPLDLNAIGTVVRHNEGAGYSGHPTDGPTTDDLISTTPFSIAHRGSGGEFPEHTMMAYESAVAAGASAIEVSVQLTADGVLVCYHDTDLERMSGIVGSSVGDYSYAQLSQFAQVKAQDSLGDGWSDQLIPTLRDVLDRFFGKVVIFLEGKDNPSIPVIQSLLLSDYPNAQKSIVWKNYYTSPSFTWAQANGFIVWAYMDVGTTSGQLDAVDANVDWWGVPVAADDTQFTNVVNRGKLVIAWPVHRHEDISRLTGLGVEGLMESEWIYLNNDVAMTEDRFETRVKSPGIIGVNPDNPNYSLKYDVNGRAFITQIPNNAVLMGGHRVSTAQAAGTYTIAYTMTWDNIPGANLHSGVAFCKPTDEAYIFSASNPTGGYHVVFRNTGTLQLYRHDAGVTTGTQLASLATEAPVAGVPMTFTVTVTPTDITVVRTDVGPYSINSTDTTNRGRYWHLSPGSVTVANTTPYFEDILIT